MEQGNAWISRPFSNEGSVWGYDAPGAQLERGYRAYIAARVHGTDTHIPRMVTRSAIRRSEAERRDGGE